MNLLSVEANVKNKGIMSSIAQTRSELKKVHWPKKKQLINYTWIVVLSVFLMSIFFYIVDSILGFIIEKVISL